MLISKQCELLFRLMQVCLFSEIRLESANNRGACLSFEYDVSSKRYHNGSSYNIKIIFT